MDKKEVLNSIFTIINMLDPKSKSSQIETDNLETLYFFGKEIELQPRDLIYLLNEISDIYHKKITPDKFSEYHFEKVGELVNFILEA